MTITTFILDSSRMSEHGFKVLPCSFKIKRPNCKQTENTLQQNVKQRMLHKKKCFFHKINIYTKHLYLSCASNKYQCTYSSFNKHTVSFYLKDRYYILLFLWIINKTGVVDFKICGEEMQMYLAYGYQTTSRMYYFMI